MTISNDTLYHTQNDGTVDVVVLPPLGDHDWYEIGTSVSPDAITDNIWTEGYVIVGTSDNSVQADTPGIAMVVDGHIVPHVNGAYELGTSSYRWRKIWAQFGVFNPSDRRLKTDIEQMHYGIKEVLQLDPVTYNWKDPEFNDGTPELGLIAQDLYKVIPEIVEVDGDTSNLMSVNYTSLIPVLIQAIKDQQALIVEQQRQIDELRAEQAKSEEALGEIGILKAENESLKGRLDAIEDFLDFLKKSTSRE